MPAVETQRHLVLASSSYLSGMPLEAYVGLGGAAVADEVIVEWPDGRTQTLRDVPPTRCCECGYLFLVEVVTGASEWDQGSISVRVRNGNS